MGRGLLTRRANNSKKERVKFLLQTLTSEGGLLKAEGRGGTENERAVARPEIRAASSYKRARIYACNRANAGHSDRRRHTDVQRGQRNIASASPLQGRRQISGDRGQLRRASIEEYRRVAARIR